MQTMESFTWEFSIVSQLRPNFSFLEVIPTMRRAIQTLPLTSLQHYYPIHSLTANSTWCLSSVLHCPNTEYRIPAITISFQLPTRLLVRTLVIDLYKEVESMNIINFVRVLLIAGIAVLWGCSTTKVSMQYEGNPEPDKTISSGIGKIQVKDDRGTDPDWMGAIRGGYGNVLKSLRTERPMAEIIENVYRQAFEEYGYLDEPNGQVTFVASIEKMDCSYFFNREAHAHIKVSLYNRGNDALLFENRYVTDISEGGVGAGIFGDVETLRDFGEKALNQTVDKSMTDLTFIAALASAGKPIENQAVETLKKLQELHKQGLISDEEYSINKQKALDSM